MRAFGIEFKKHAMKSLMALAASWILFTVCERVCFGCCVSVCVSVLPVEGEVAVCTGSFKIISQPAWEPLRTLSTPDLEVQSVPSFPPEPVCGRLSPQVEQAQPLPRWWGSQRQASPPSGVCCLMTRGGPAVMIMIMIIIIEITCTIKVIKAYQALAHTVTPGVEDELEMLTFCRRKGSAQQALPEDAACLRPALRRRASAPRPAPLTRSPGAASAGGSPASRQGRVGRVLQVLRPRRGRFESSWNHPLTPLCGKTVFHEALPWCQKAWGWLLRADPLPTCSVSEPSSVSRGDESKNGEGRGDVEVGGG